MTAKTVFTFSSNPEIKFNDVTDPANYYNLLNRLFDTEVKNVEDQKRDSGIEDYSSTLGKGIAKLKVAILAESMGKLNELVKNLKQAFNPVLEQENVLSDEGYLPIKWTEVIGTTSYNVLVYVKAVEIPRVSLDEKGSGAMTEILIKAKDPIKFGQADKTITVTAGNATGTNSGDMTTFPILTITGPSGVKPKVLYNETGEYMEINDTLTGSDSYVIDMKKATIKKNGVNAYDKKTAGSVFFDLGAGTITLVGSNMSSGHTAVVYKDAWTL